MIKITDLRRGNYLRSITPGQMSELEYVTVQNLEGEAIYCKEGIGFNSEYGEGIPITEDWLIKFGFEKSSLTHGWIIEGDLQIFPPTDSRSLWSIRAEVHIAEFHLIAVVHHLNELQNLIYVLTGAELIDRS